MIPFREETPIRVYSRSKPYAGYRSYKDKLRTDFNKKCGYCDVIDLRIGGRNNMHIDHFIPWKRFFNTSPEIKTDYNNLVYACPYCNGFKSDDWPSNDININGIANKGYLDPCNKEYDEIFSRTKNGLIVALTPLAEYMHQHLGLGLKRHKLLWQLEKVYSLRKEIKRLLVENKLDEELTKGLNDLRNKLADKYMDIEEKYRELLS